MKSFLEFIIKIIVFIFIFIFNISLVTGATISWTGSANKDWSNPGNWSSGTVPTMNDEVFITGPIVYNITVDGDFECLRLSIGSNVHNVYIPAGASLLIDGQNTVNTDLLLVSSSSSMENAGELIVKKLATSQENELIDIEGTFTNREDAILSVSFISFSGTNTGEKNREAINIGNNGELINEGTINMDYLDGSGIVVNGSLSNELTGIINLYQKIDFTGIILVDGSFTPSFYNYGQLISTMNDLTSSSTIHSFQDTEIFNHGLIKITGSTKPTYAIHMRGDFTNFTSGTLEILNSKGMEYGFPSSGVMEFLNEGTVSFLYAGSNVGTALSIRDGATVNNMSVITTSGYAVGLGTTLAGNLVNQASGIVSISGSTNSGFNNAGELTNYGNLTITNCGNESFRNLYTTVNHSSGTISVINADGWGLRNARAVNSSPHANLINYGKLNISALNDDIAIYNFDQSIFNQSGKIDITSASKVTNLSPATFKMKDTINAVEFDNRGVLEFLPSFQPYVFDGDLTLAGTGSIDYYISSSVNTRQIKVQGNLQVDGELDLEFEAGFIPGAFQTIELIEQTGTRVGFFESFIPEFPLNDHDLSYSDPNIVKLSHNSCGNAVVENKFLLSSGTWSNSSNWSLGHVPYPCEEVVLQPFGNDSMVVSMNSNSPEIAKLTIYGNAELIIEPSKTLTINREYKEHQGQEALYINIGGKLSNNGTLFVDNVESGSFIRNFGEIINDDLIHVKSGYNLGIEGVRNFGLYRNTDQGVLLVTDLDAGPAGIALGVYNVGAYIENGDSFMDYGYHNHGDGNIFGNGTITTPSVSNHGTINPGDDIIYDIGHLTIAGLLASEIGSKIQIDVGGLAGSGQVNGHDQLTVTMKVTLKGEIEFVNDPNFDPSPVDQFPFLFYQSGLVGNFDSETFPVEFTDWNVVNNGVNQLILMLDETCEFTNIEWTGMGAGNGWFNSANWSKGFVPKACHNVFIGPQNEVYLYDAEIANVAYLELNTADLSIANSAKLFLHGVLPTEATLNLINSSFINKGEVIINITDSNLSLKIDDNSFFRNVNSLKLQSF